MLLSGNMAGRFILRLSTLSLLHIKLHFVLRKYYDGRQSHQYPAWEFCLPYCHREISMRCLCIFILSSMIAWLSVLGVPTHTDYVRFRAMSEFQAHSCKLSATRLTYCSWWQDHFSTITLCLASNKNLIAHRLISIFSPENADTGAKPAPAKGRIYILFLLTFFTIYWVKLIYINHLVFLQFVLAAPAAPPAGKLIMTLIEKLNQFSLCSRLWITDQ